ncbi:glycosyltransferase family 2 protein [Mucilaginibacter sp.]|uniref:glycosyltransferase family 2 protein n=1 Tax=Mucilaginibacter sp. TaxID=1882438 RepID=UPI0026223E8A|nr:glycosyltransferase family 2 protein [Mucilaginibacter sp.]
MNEALVSIIIPVYNAENYLAETIKSALEQTWQNKEIIIVDDGSTDNSLYIARNFECDLVKVLSQQNKGASAARNTGLKEAKGEYIQFLDADDLLSNNKIEVQINLLLNLRGYLALCVTVHFQNGTEPTSLLIRHDWYAEGSDNPADFLIKLYGGGLIGPTYGGMIQPNAWLVPNDVITKAGFWNEDLTVDDDGEFFCRVVLASRGITYAADAVNYYRKFNTSNSLSGQKDRQASSSILKSTDLKASYLLSRTDNHNAKMALSRLYYENAFSFYPKYMDLALEAEKKGKALTPDFSINPYNSGATLILSKLIGWKAVRYLQYLKDQTFHK